MPRAKDPERPATGKPKPPGYKGTGRPTKRHDMIPRVDYDRVTRMCMLGMTNEQLAASFEVDVATISTWMLDDQNFRNAVRAGREDADGAVVQSLFSRALGYSHKATKILTVAQGNNQGSSIEEVEYTEHYPPDATSMIFWLKNRRPKEWREKNETELSGPGGAALTPPVINVQLVAGPMKKVDGDES